MISFPKHFAVFNNFFRWFTFYFFGNRIKDILENGDPEDEDDDIVTSSSDDSGDDLSISKMSDIIDGENIK